MNEGTDVFAIDPGPTQSTYVRAVFTGGGGLLDNEVRIVGAASMPNEELCAMFKLPPDMDDTHVVCEMVACYGMPVGKETFETVRWIGRYEQRLLDNGLRFHTMNRLHVKLAICNDSRAKDGNIRQGLINRYGEPGTKRAPGVLYGISGHAWQALALAVAYKDQLSAASRAAIAPQAKQPTTTAQARATVTEGPGTLRLLP